MADNRGISNEAKMHERAAHEDIVTYLTTQHDINAADTDGDTLLHIAAANGEVAEVQKLLARGASIHIKNVYKSTAIMNAARLPSDEGTVILGMLLEINAGAMIKRSALRLAIRSGNARSASLLLPVTDKKDQNNSLFSSFPDYCPWYARMMYDAFDHKNVIELLTVLKSGGANFNYCIKGMISLLDVATCNFVKPAICFGHTIGEHFDQTFELIQFLVENGADVRRNSCGNNKPLHILLSESSVWVPVDDKRFRQLFEYFIQQGADVNAIGSNGKTPLQIATECNNLLAINILTAHGANNISDNQALDCEEGAHKLSRFA
jgi:ankyrin repeat protein